MPILNFGTQRVKHIFYNTTRVKKAFYNTQLVYNSEVNITFVENGVSTTVAYEYGATINRTSTPNATYAQFVGWSTKSNGSNPVAQPIATQDMTLYRVVKVKDQYYTDRFWTDGYGHYRSYEHTLPLDKSYYDRLETLPTRQDNWMLNYGGATNVAGGVAGVYYWTCGHYGNVSKWVWTKVPVMANSWKITVEGRTFTSTTSGSEDGDLSQTRAIGKTMVW